MLSSPFSSFTRALIFPSPNQEIPMSSILILYYSSTGTARAMAQAAADGLIGHDVRLRKLPETAPQSVIDGQEKWKAEQTASAHIPTVTLEDMEWAQGILFVFPTRFGNIPSQLSAFLDTLGGLWFAGKLANKAVSAMVSASNPHGGQEGSLFALYHSLMHWGAVLVPPGYTDGSIFAAGGNPYGYSHTAGTALDEVAVAAIHHQAKRLAQIADQLA
jgi:NAD(P)H dehydrogenase (quinone)